MRRPSMRGAALTLWIRRGAQGWERSHRRDMSCAVSGVCRRPGACRFAGAGAGGTPQARPVAMAVSTLPMVGHGALCERAAAAGVPGRPAPRQAGRTDSGSHTPWQGAANMMTLTPGDPMTADTSFVHHDAHSLCGANIPNLPCHNHVGRRMCNVARAADGAALSSWWVWFVPGLQNPSSPQPQHSVRMVEVIGVPHPLTVPRSTNNLGRRLPNPHTIVVPPCPQL